MPVNITFKKDVQWLSIVEDMEKIFTTCSNTLKLDLSNSSMYPTLNITGSLDAGGIEADKLRTSRRIDISGDASGYANFDGSSNIEIALTIASATPKAHTHNTVDISDANSLNISNVIVKRDEFGDFSARNITANLTGNVIGNITGSLTGNASGSSSNVTTYINNVSISSIFESNGSTVKLATSAGYASNSDTVDGQHASAFALSSHNHSASQITSGILNYSLGVVAGSSENSFLGYTGVVNNNGYLYGGSTAPTGTARLNYSGYFYATRVYNAIYNDFAECFIPENGIIYNDVIHRIVEINSSGKVQLADYKSNGVVGIVSDNYGMLLGGSDEEIENGTKIPVGLTGTLWVDSAEAVKQEHLHSFVCSGGNGYALAVDKTASMYYNGCIVGKIIDIDLNKNRFKVILALR